MTTVQIRSSTTYEVQIGYGIWNTLGKQLKTLAPKSNKIALVSESNVAPLYSQQVETILKKSNYQVVTYVFPAGEQSKNGETYLSLLEFLANEQITRSDALLALGGGVVGDLTGFVAATYLRGISYIQLPTTLLAAVDASVGGKTAIDLKAGKNLAGAFYQPKCVICDLDSFKTLPKDVFADGMAEVIKYGMIGDRNLLETLEKDKVIEALVATCVAMKGDIVSRDEFDRGERQLLNLGHTLGHGIEHCSQFSLSHGKCVAIGMAMVCRSAVATGLCTPEVLTCLLKLLKRYNLPNTTEYTSKEIFDKALGDKKRTGNQINLIVPVTLGKSVLHTIDIKQLLDFIERGRQDEA